jgi:hypothetical protein
VPSKRTTKLCTHAHHSDCSVAAAVFANGNYFVDMPLQYPAIPFAHAIRVKESCDSVHFLMKHHCDKYFLRICGAWKGIALLGSQLSYMKFFSL